MSSIDQLTRQQLNSRQSQVMHPRMSRLHVVVAGAGMVGSWAALALARVVGKLTVLDFDVVEKENLGIQCYSFGDDGMSKVEALARMCVGFPVTVIEGRAPEDFPKLGSRDTVVVSAVDSLDSRREIGVAAYEAKVPFLVETRVRGDLLAVLTVGKRKDYASYIEDIPKEEDVEDVPCGMTGATYTGMIAGGKILASVNSWLGGIPTPAMRLYHVSTDQIVADRREW